MADERVELLRRVPLFAELERREVEQLAAPMKERTFRAGEEITTEGEHAVGFFVILGGEATVSVQGAPRGVLGPGDYFGEIALIAGSDRTATVTATTELRCLGMTFWQFRPIVESNGALAWRLLQTLAKRLHDAEVAAKTRS